MAKYRTKPKPEDIIDAVQWTGENNKEIQDLCGFPIQRIKTDPVHGKQFFMQLTGENTFRASLNDWIIMHRNWPKESIRPFFCKPDDFNRMYERYKPVEKEQ